MDPDLTGKIEDPRLLDGRPERRTPGQEHRQMCLLVLSGPRCGEVLPLRQRDLLIGRGDGAHLRIPAEGVSRRHARLLLYRGAWLLFDLGSRNGTLVNRRPVRRALLRDGDQIQLGAGSLLKFSRQDAIDLRFQQQLLEAALRDSLTKVFNRRYFMERLRGEVAYAARHLRPLSLLLMDVDHFKRINDEYGHPAGDVVLCAICAAISRAIRSEDVLARVGGEEFAVLCRGVGRADAQLFGERILATVAAHPPIAPRGRPLRVTLSLGVAELTRDLYLEEGSVDCSVERLMTLADQALYAAKRAGRGCVRVAQIH
jgi:diguanylate cyclase (GGDEF)-like protein